MPNFTAVARFNKLPATGFVPETSGTAPTTPVVGQLWTDSTVANAVVTKVYTGSTNGWQPLLVYAGTTAGTYAAGNDARITGAEQTANKGAASGYAPLDSNSKVPTANLPTGTGAGELVVGDDTRFNNIQYTGEKNAANGYAGLNASTQIAFSQIPVGTTASTVVVGNDARVTGAQQTSQKNAANGYAGLDGNSLISFSQIPVGTTASTVVVGNDSRFTNIQYTTQKNAANGYAGLDGSSRIATAQLPTVIPAAGTGGSTAATRYVGGTTSGAPSTGTYAVGDFVIAQNGVVYVCTVAGTPGTWVGIGLYGTTAGTAAAGNDTRIVNAEQTTNKNAANGYAGLNGSSQIAYSQIPVGQTANTITAGNDSRFTNIQYTTAKGTANGYASLDASTKVPIAQIPTGTTSTSVLLGNATLNSIATANGATAAVDLNSQRITNLGAPSAASDAARLADVQSAAAGIDVKPSVRAATTANITLSGTQTIDGVAVIAGDRVLVKNQSTATQNGPYVVAAGAWTRATDEVTANSFWFVEEGTANADSSWMVTNNGTITLGTTALVFAQFGGATTYVGTANRVTVSGTQIDIAATYVGQTSITTLGTVTTGTWNGSTIAIGNGGTGATTAAAARTNLGVSQVGYAATLGAITAGTPLTVTHNLGTQDVIAQVRDASTNEYIFMDVVNASTNTVTVRSDIAYSASATRIVVLPVL